EGLLHLREDRVIAATGAPADFLIAGEVFGGERRQGQSSGHRISKVSVLVTRASARSSVRSHSQGTAGPGSCSGPARRPGTSTARASAAGRRSTRAPGSSCSAG